MSLPSPETPLLANTRTSNGQTLAELSDQSPVLLVLLRHEGCPFCRNAMYDIARLRHQIEGAGTAIVLAHMASEEDFATFAARYGLSAIPSIANPDRSLYRGMGLRRASLLRLMGPRVLWALLKARLAGHRQGPVKGDPFQLPGAFLLHQGKVVRGYAYRHAADRPDYVSLATLQN